MAAYGLSDKQGIICLNSFGDGFEAFYNTGGTIVDGFYDEKATLMRPVFLSTGDVIMKDFGILDISVLKVDVEGAELKVFEGFKKTIKNARPFIVTEILPPSLRGGSLKDFESSSTSILTWFELNNYTLFQIDRSGKLKICKKEILASGKKMKSSSTRDYLGVPNEHVENFLQIFS